MIIQICGEHDTGKTLAALQYHQLKKTAYFFDDVKGPPIDPYDIDIYYDLSAMDLKLLEFREEVLKLIDNLPKGLESIIFDTWTRFGSALVQYGRLNVEEFRERETLSAMGKIKGSEGWAEGARHEGQIISALHQRCKDLFLISHLKDDYQGQVPTGRKIPATGRILNKACNLRLWLRHNPDSPVPIILVLKRIALPKIVAGKLQVVNVLPRKIKPLESELSVWEAIDRYMQQPMGNREPIEDETPTDHELSILDGILTDDQKEVWKANLTHQVVEVDEVKAFILAENGASPLELKQMIKDNFGQDLSLREIQEMRL